MKLANTRLKPETVSLDGQRIDKDYEIRFAVKENWLWVFLFYRNYLNPPSGRPVEDKATWPSLRAS